MAQDVPPVPYNVQMLTDDGIVSRPWAEWFRQVFARIGGHSGKVVFGTPVTGAPTVTGSSYINFSTVVSVSFKAAVSGLYRVSFIGAVANTTAGGNYLKITGTSGSPTATFAPETYLDIVSTNKDSNVSVVGFFTLVAGTAYTFNLQGKVGAGTMSMDGGAGGITSGYALVAEQLQ